MGSQRKEKAVVRTPFAQALQDVEDLDITETVAAQLGRDGHGEKTEVGAGLPCLAQKPLLFLGLGSRRRSSGKLSREHEGRLLQRRHRRPDRAQTASTGSVAGSFTCSLRCRSNDRLRATIASSG